MKTLLKGIIIIPFLVMSSVAKADFGDADFPSGRYAPKTSHNAWCRVEKNKCRIYFDKNAKWVEGEGGIYRSQFISYSKEKDKN